jgi:hypothetical protein
MDLRLLLVSFIIIIIITAFAYRKNSFGTEMWQEYVESNM